MRGGRWFERTFRNQSYPAWQAHRCGQVRRESVGLNPYTSTLLAGYGASVVAAVAVGLVPSLSNASDSAVRAFVALLLGLLAQQLQQRVDTLLADARASNPALADGGPTAGTSIDLLAYVFGRALDAAGQLAEYADSARIAGLTCARAYDSLSLH